MRADADRAAEHGEVLGADHDVAPVDRAGAGDEAVGGDLRLAADQRAELDEAAGVEQRRDALADVEPPGGVLARDALGATHRAGVGVPLLEVLEDRLPRGGYALVLCHACRVAARDGLAQAS